MRNKMNVEIAECAKCGVEIEFATSEEFEKLVNEHVHRYPLG
jgi:Zn ribbon nucleic-acid-binding protein